MEISTSGLSSNPNSEVLTTMTHNDTTKVTKCIEINNQLTTAPTNTGDQRSHLFIYLQETILIKNKTETNILYVSRSEAVCMVRARLVFHSFPVPPKSSVLLSIASLLSSRLNLISHSARDLNFTYNSTFLITPFSQNPSKPLTFFYFLYRSFRQFLCSSLYV